MLQPDKLIKVVNNIETVEKKVDEEKYETIDEEVSTDATDA